MAASVVNILIEQGSTFIRKLEFKDSLGVAINLSGFSFRGSIRKTSKSTAEVLADFEFEIQLPESDGVAIMSISAENTAKIPTTGENYSKLTVYTYDVEMIDSNGIVTRIMNGNASISPEVTR